MDEQARRKIDELERRVVELERQFSTVPLRVPPPDALGDAFPRFAHLDAVLSQGSEAAPSNGTCKVLTATASGSSFTVSEVTPQTKIHDIGIIPSGKQLPSGALVMFTGMGTRKILCGFSCSDLEDAS